MKEEFGEEYKDSENSGWKESKGVPGLAKVGNPFKKKGENSKKEFKKLDVNKDKALSLDELGTYVSSHSELWTMLGMSLDLNVKKCIELATDVAFTLASGEGVTKPKKNEYYRKKDRELTEAEFTHFHKNYVLDPEGARLFYLRTIFAAFDVNGDGVLERNELDRFLDVFYEAGSVFKGNKRLPDKKELQRIVIGRLDKNKDGALNFQEMRSLLEVVAVVTSDK
jgi:Ca2+-binding EF-hand superfamily protein